jgi:hypothetical protein
MRQTIRIFDPRLGSLRGALIGADRESDSGVPVELFHVDLETNGQITLHLRSVGATGRGRRYALERVREHRDGALELTLSDGRRLRFPAEQSAGVRDLILSLANRTTPYF